MADSEPDFFDSEYSYITKTIDQEWGMGYLMGEWEIGCYHFAKHADYFINFLRF